MILRVCYEYVFDHTYKTHLIMKSDFHPTFILIRYTPGVQIQRATKMIKNNFTDKLRNFCGTSNVSSLEETYTVIFDLCIVKYVRILSYVLTVYY